jgi:hypothetical protein
VDLWRPWCLTSPVVWARTGGSVARRVPSGEALYQAIAIHLTTLLHDHQLTKWCDAQLGKIGKSVAEVDGASGP